jgi:hypothetical protein
VTEERILGRSDHTRERHVSRLLSLGRAPTIAQGR